MHIQLLTIVRFFDNTALLHPREIAAIWETDEIRRQRPTPQDEARSGMNVIETTMWDALPRFMRTLDDASRARLGRPLPPHASPVQIGSWMGGDRDGNPNVTAHVTREVCLLARSMAADLFARDMATLHVELSMNSCRYD